MKDYIEISFGKDSSENDLLMASLAANGYEGFEQTDDGLKAYIPNETFNREELVSISSQFSIPFNEKLIPATNWNAQWESGFEPVVVDSFVSIRAHFHQPVHGVQHEILITPKMSFGTGHHATTYLMISAMRYLNFKEKDVLDFGTGTGVLAILAKKLGAQFVKAIDIDEWSIENAKENIDHNNCQRIELELADRPDQTMQFDIILANINRNIILEHLPVLAGMIRKDGIILLSGLLVEDELAISKQAETVGLKLSEKNIRDNWLSLQYSH